MRDLSTYRGWLASKAAQDALDTGDMEAQMGLAFTAAYMAGRYDVAMEAEHDDIALAESQGSARLPFREQIDFFRRKVRIPTRSWTDIWQSQHDVAFVVAGAARDDLLNDLYNAVDQAISEGTTLASFKREFGDIVDKHGWRHTGGRDWRARVIYNTNLRTSYSAGRWQQIQAVKETRPYVRYRHSHAVVQPRELHLSWDGTVLRVDDPWLRTHAPTNGWGCQCYLESLSERNLEKLGKSGPDKAPAIRYHTVTVGKTGPMPRTVRVPEGIDPGFAYAPGRVSQLGEAVRHRLLASATKQPHIASLGVKAMLERPSVSAAEMDRWRNWLREGKDGEIFEVDVLDGAVLGWLDREKSLSVGSATMAVTRKDLRHGGRGTDGRSPLDEADLARLPDVLRRPEAVLFDGSQKTPVLLYVFSPAQESGKGKLVVKVNVYRTGRVVGKDNLKRKVRVNAVRTSGYVALADLKTQQYELVVGELK